MLSRVIDQSVFIEPEFDVTFVTKGTVTVAKLSSGGDLMTVGAAFRSPDDVPCEAVGRAYALHRALWHLSEQYLELAVYLDSLNSEGVA